MGLCEILADVEVITFNFVHRLFDVEIELGPGGRVVCNDVEITNFPHEAAEREVKIFRQGIFTVIEAYNGKLNSLASISYLSFTFTESKTSKSTKISLSAWQ